MPTLAFTPRAVHPVGMAPIDYKQAGVDYGKIDPLKILAQQAAAATAGNLRRHGLQEVGASRGESAYLVDCGDFYLASITECLGTKALVADATRKVTGRTYYDQIAQDTLAMAINDLITVGATPVSVHAYPPCVSVVVASSVRLRGRRRCNASAGRSLTPFPEGMPAPCRRLRVLHSVSTGRPS